MPFVYILFTVMFIQLIIETFKAIRKKNYLDVILAVLFFTFMFALFIGSVLGGSAVRCPMTDNPLYQSGHYYLNHGSEWTEVSRTQYYLVLVSEVVGFSCFFPAFALAAIRNNKKKPKAEQLPKHM